MSGEMKRMRMPGFFKRKSSNGMIREFLRESFMLVRKFFCIGLVSDFLQENYSLNGKDHMLLWKCTAQVLLRSLH
jgi:hypothetical protein